MAQPAVNSFDRVVLGSFVAHLRGIRFSDFGVFGVRACRGECSRRSEAGQCA